MKYKTTIAALSFWVFEGVLNNIMDNDRLLREYSNYWKSLLQDVRFVDKIGRACWRRDDSRHVAMRRCPCCACMQWVHGDEVLWRHGKDATGAVLRLCGVQLDLHESSEGLRILLRGRVGVCRRVSARTRSSVG